MAAKIRLKKIGTKGRPCFKIIVCDRLKRRDARPIEEIGFYDPTKNPPVLRLNKERTAYWVGVGAQISDTVRSIIDKQ